MLLMLSIAAPEHTGACISPQEKRLVLWNFNMLSTLYLTTYWCPCLKLSQGVPMAFSTNPGGGGVFFCCWWCLERRSWRHWILDEVFKLKKMKALNSNSMRRTIYWWEYQSRGAEEAPFLMTLLKNSNGNKSKSNRCTPYANNQSSNHPRQYNNQPPISAKLSNNIHNSRDK